jgi:flavin-binding protein dodecin
VILPTRRDKPTRGAFHGWWALPEEVAMADHVYKVVEVVGTSKESISKAIETGMAKAARSLRQLGWFEVISIRGQVADGKINHYQVALKVGFTLEDR